MANYIDSFIFPIAKEHLETYQSVAEEVAKIWKEHGALAYFEYLYDDLKFEGTRTFPEFVNTNEKETIIFGWTAFESREARDLAHKRVENDPRMTELVKPIMDPSNIIFDAQRMVYGGFKSFVQ